MESFARTGALLLLLLGLLALQPSHSSPVVSEEQMVKAAKMMRGVCQPKTGATDAQLDELSSGTISDAKEVKCYAGCFMSTVRTIKNGKIDAKMMKMQAEKMMPPDKRDVTISGANACKDVEGADNCDLAYNFLVCAQKNNPEKFFFPV